MSYRSQVPLPTGSADRTPTNGGLAAARHGMGYFASRHRGVAHSCFSDTASSLLPLRSYGTDSRSVFANIKPRGVSGHTQSGSFSTPTIQSNIHLTHRREDHLMLCHDMRAFRLEFYRASTNPVGILRGVGFRLWKARVGRTLAAKDPHDLPSFEAERRERERSQRLHCFFFPLS